MIDAVKIVGRIPLTAFFHQIGGALKHPTVHLLKLVARKSVARRIKVADIAKSETERVSNFSIGFADLYHYSLAPFYVCPILQRHAPQTEQVPRPTLAN